MCLTFFKGAKEPTKHEIYLLKRDLPEKFFKKLMKIPQSQKKLKFPPKCNDSYYEHLLPSKIIIIVNINCLQPIFNKNYHYNPKNSILFVYQHFQKSHNEMSHPVEM